MLHEVIRAPMSLMIAAGWLLSRLTDHAACWMNLVTIFNNKTLVHFAWMLGL